MLDRVPQDLVDILAEHGQSHLCRWWNDLDADGRSHLVSQLREIDFALMDRLVAEHIKSKRPKSDSRGAAAKPPARLERLCSDDSLTGAHMAAVQAGEELLRAGKVAALVVAGGQGSRLGFDQPKGLFPIGPITGKSLFQLHFEQLEALSARYGCNVPYFIMTSEATDAATKEFLDKNDYFGYSFHDVYIFQQGWLPAVDEDGKILLADKHEIAASPDGHGGTLAALQRAGLIEIMRERGLEHVYYHQIDNPTAKICDPVFLGLHARHQSEATTKVVAKTGPSEKMGVVVDLDGVTQIIEYSDLTEDQQAATDSDGNLLLWAGNTAIHAFDVGLLERLTTGEKRLPFHRAHKKVSFLRDDGSVETPSEPNAFKFEQFIFDALPMAKSALVVEADRTREFNPVKNAEGSDSPETARAALLANARQICIDAGAKVSADAKIEISPLYGMTADDLAGKLDLSQPLTGEVYLEPEEV